MKSSRRNRWLCLLAGVWLATLGCTPTSSEPGLSASGSAQVMGALQQSERARNVTQVRLSVSAADMTTRTLFLSQTAGQWGGIVSPLPVGVNRTFSAVALDASGTTLFEGQAAGVTILPDQTVVVSLTLQQVPRPDPFGNAAPCITSLIASPASVATGGTVSLVATAEDPDVGDTLSYAWTATAGSFAAPDHLTTGWTAPAQTGPVTLTLTVTDSKGATATLSLTIPVHAGEGSAAVQVSLNSWPTVTRILASPSAVAVGETTRVTATASDNDGDTLTYAWTAGCAGTWEDAQLATARFTPSAQPPGTSTCGNCPLTVTVADGRGGQTTGNFSICVGPRPTARFPPEITLAYQSAASAPARATLAFQVEAKDPQGSALSFSWRANTGTLGTAQHTASGSQVSWTAPDCTLSGTTPTLQATVTNALGLSVSRQFKVTGPASCDGMTCENGKTDCGGVCSDLKVDTAHCGTCGNACRGGETCTQGACACSQGTVDCGNMCASLDNNPQHCGACGRACPAGASCNGGTCVASCSAGQVSCNGYCVDPSNDSTNCGGCGQSCGTGATCDAGACRCAPGDVLCGGACRQTRSDPANCGGCGVTCRSDQTCSNGQCQCPAGSTLCGGKCVDTTSDALNCGACGRQCGDLCVSGTCTQAFTCQSTFTTAPAGCAAFPLDKNRCGAVESSTVTQFSGVEWRGEFKYPLNAAHNEKFELTGSFACNEPSGGLMHYVFQSEQYQTSMEGEVVVAAAGGAQVSLKSEASPYACSRPGTFWVYHERCDLTNRFPNLFLKRSKLSGHYNTGGATPASATTLATGSNGQTCEQVCGTLKSVCATREDWQQYYRVVIPPRSALLVESLLEEGAGINELHATQGNGKFICTLYSANTGNVKRARLLNNSLVPQEVILNSSSYRGYQHKYNTAFAVEPL